MQLMQIKILSINNVRAQLWLGHQPEAQRSSQKTGREGEELLGAEESHEMLPSGHNMVATHVTSQYLWLLA